MEPPKPNRCSHSGEFSSSCINLTLALRTSLWPNSLPKLNLLIALNRQLPSLLILCRHRGDILEKGTGIIGSLFIVTCLSIKQEKISATDTIHEFVGKTHRGLCQCSSTEIHSTSSLFFLILATNSFSLSSFDLLKCSGNDMLWVGKFGQSHKSWHSLTKLSSLSDYLSFLLVSISMAHFPFLDTFFSVGLFNCPMHFPHVPLPFTHLCSDIYAVFLDELYFPVPKCMHSTKYR